MGAFVSIAKAVKRSIKTYASVSTLQRLPMDSQAAINTTAEAVAAKKERDINKSLRKTRKNA